MTIAVTENELLSAMVEGYSYRQYEVVDLLSDKPKSATMDALAGLIRKGVVWQTYATGRWEYVRLTPEQLAEMRQRRADRVESPAWMKGVLTGYEASLFKRASIPEPTSYRT